MRPIDSVLDDLQRSAFRRRFRLGAKELEILRAKSLEGIKRHAGDIIAWRLAPARPPNDGKQTPMRGHPVFIAQHATATCCRGCLAKWHGIGSGKALSADEQRYVVAVISRWLEIETVAAPAPPEDDAQGRLL